MLKRMTRYYLPVIVLAAFIAACSPSAKREEKPVILKAKENTIVCLDSNISQGMGWIECKLKNGKWAVFYKNEIDNYYEIIQQ